jgi:hypothetical protein
VSKVSCELEYRTYIPHLVIAIPFCSVQFSGKDWYDYHCKWQDVNRKGISELRQWHDRRKANLEYEIKQLETKLAELEDDRTWWQRLFGIVTPYVVERNALSEEYYDKKHDLNNLEDEPDGESKAYRSMSLAKDFLRANGFRLVHTSKDTDCCVTTTEIWEK